MVVIATASLSLVLPVPAASAATVPSGFTVATVASGLANATAVAPLPDGRVLVAQQGGQLRMVKNGVLLATPVLSVTVDTTGERGLIGVTAQPSFASTGRIFIHYVMPAGGGQPPRARVERWTLPAGADVAAPASRRVVLTLPGLVASNHNGGAIHFDRAGKLMVAVGENAVPDRSQDLTSPFGKILRVEPATGEAAAGNPFLSDANGWTRRVWAYGLRNPYTFAVGKWGRVLINDVGQSTWEEINLGAPGANFGWPASEGPDGTAGFTAPIEYYGHDSGCSIAGGAFYQPSTVTFPQAFVGDYFYGDFCAGSVRRYDVATDKSTGFATAMGNVVDMATAPRGRLLVLSRTTLWGIDHPGT